MHTSILALFALSCSISQAAGQAQQPNLSAYSNASDAYVRAFSSVKTPLWVDLPDAAGNNNAQPVVPSGLRPLESNPTRQDLRLVGLALGRDTRLCEGAWVLCRSAAFSSFESEDDGPILFNWLAKLDSAKLSGLCGAEGSAFDGLDQDGQDFVARLTRNNVGLQKAVADQSDMKVRLCYVVRVEVTDPRSGRKGESYILGEALDPVKCQEAKRAVQPGESLGEPGEGALDFGDGRVAPLREILVEASQSLGVRFVLDRRFLECAVFVKGRFTPKRLRAVLKEYATAVPADVIEESAEARSKRFLAARQRALELIASLADSGAKDKELKDQLLNGDQEMTGDKAAQLSQELKDYLQAKGFGPEARIKLSRYLMVRVSAAGATGGVKNDVRFGFNQ